MQINSIKRYWFKFKFNDNFKAPSGTIIGCGITAYNYEDAISILQEKVFANQDIAVIDKVIENIDISSLDPGHIIPNMKPPIYRGVWFPGKSFYFLKHFPKKNIHINSPIDPPAN